MLVLFLLLISRLIERSGLRISHSKVFSSDQVCSRYPCFCYETDNFHLLFIDKITIRFAKFLEKLVNYLQLL